MLSVSILRFHSRTCTNVLELVLTCLIGTVFVIFAVLIVTRHGLVTLMSLIDHMRSSSLDFVSEIRCDTAARRRAARSLPTSVRHATCTAH